MERNEIWVRIFCAAIVAQREKPEEHADTQLKEYDKRFSFPDKEAGKSKP